MENQLCKMLGIDVPIILGGMMFVGRAPLVASVSQAGGLGILGAGRMKPQELRDSIKDIRARTSKPFGVNLPLISPGIDQLVRVILEESVTVVSTSAGNPAKYAGRLKESGTAVIHVAATVRQAMKADAAGVDAVVAEGSESGGFLGKDKVSTMALVPQVVDAVEVPVIAAGGIVDGRGMAAAFALGAVGVQMGTRFLAATECSSPPDYKLAVLLAKDTDTWVAENASGAGRRLLKKDLLNSALKALNDPETLLPDGVSRPYETGGQADPGRRERGYSAGQGAGMLRDIITAQEIVLHIMAQARSAVQSLPGCLG